MCLQVVARERSITSCIAVVVASALGRACAAVVLREAIYGLVAPSKVFAVFIISGLHRIYISGCDIQCKLRILTVGSACAIHNRRCDIYLRSKERGNTCRTVLLRGFLTDLSRQLRIHGRCQGNRLDQTGNICRVDRDHSRDTV